MRAWTKLTSLLAILFISTGTFADPITIEVYPDYGQIPDILGGHTTTSYTINGTDGTAVSSFTTDSGNVISLSPDVAIMSPEWVYDPNGDTIFGVPGSTVTLTPDSPLAAISFMIHSTFSGGLAWVSADWTDSSGGSGTLRNPETGYFSIDQGSLDGVGVGIYAEPGACITSVTIDPIYWGFGSISTADATSCTSVPEPGTLSLLGLGLLGLGFAQARRRRRIG